MANYIKFVFLLTFIVYSDSNARFTKINLPPHCTQISKDTDYVARFRFDYDVGYVMPGQSDAVQTLYCVNPASVNKAVTMVCDWAAPPQVRYAPGDEYMTINRQDPSGRYLGYAVYTTYQLCSHNIAISIADLHL